MVSGPSKKPTFNIWPEPKDGAPYGPQPKQKLLFIEDLPDEDCWVDATTGQPAEPNSPNSINLRRST